MESQFKKPYLVGDHVPSEWQFAGTPPFYPPPPGPGPPWADCEVTGDAVGGESPDPCETGVSCGMWIFYCAHLIISFSVAGTNGWIQSIAYGGDDTVRVTVCWDESAKHNKLKVGPTVHLNNGVDFAAPNPADLSACCPEPGSDCKACGKCITLSISYVSQQMSCNGTQYLTAVGGGGRYVWSVSGGGTIAKASGFTTPTVLYTAPSSNADCANNPTITLKDCCEKIATLKIAVNCYTETGAVAYFGNARCLNDLLEITTGCIGWKGGQEDCGVGNVICHPWLGLYENSYNCVGTILANPLCNTNNEVTKCVGASADCLAGVCCDALSTGGTCHSIYPSGTFDARTTAMKTAGCCPAALL